MINDICPGEGGGIFAAGAIWGMPGANPEGHVLLIDRYGGLDWYDSSYERCVFQGVCRTSDGTYVTVGTLGVWSEPATSVILSEWVPGEQPAVIRDHAFPAAGWGLDVMQTMDGGFALLVRGNDQHAYVYKTDRLFNPLWSTELDQPSPPFFAPGNALEETPDGMYIVGGYNMLFGMCGFLFAVSSTSGDIVATGDT